MAPLKRLHHKKNILKHLIKTLFHINLFLLQLTLNIPSQSSLFNHHMLLRLSRNKKGSHGLGLWILSMLWTSNRWTALTVCTTSRECTIKQQLQKKILPANHVLLKITVPLCPWTWISVLEQGSWQGVACLSPWSPAAANTQHWACLCFPFASSSSNSPGGI